MFTTRRIREEERSDGSGVPRLSLLVRTAGFFSGWYARWKQREEEQERSARRVRLLKKTAVVLLSVLLGLVLIAGTVKALVVLRILTPHSLFAVAGTDLPTDESGFTNILLVGGGDKSHDGVDLLDSMMVASVDAKKTKSVFLLSLPRDLYIENAEKMGRGRINSLYRDYKYYLRSIEEKPEAQASKEALTELAKEVGVITGLDIHRVVKVDFIAFVQAVDALGGVDLEVPYDIVDTEYPGPNYSYETFEIRAGLQHLDGETALKYARSRHTTSDFGRSARQQQLLSALADKAKTEGIITSPGKITSLLKILADHVETTLTYSEMIGGGALAEGMEKENLISAQLNAQDGYEIGPAIHGGFLYFPPRDLYNGASVIRPIQLAGSDEWSQIRTFVRLLTQNRSIVLAHPSIVILNGGAANGLGRRLERELIRHGFDVTDTANASDDRASALRNLDQSLILTRMPEDDTLGTFFSTLLQIPTGPIPLELPAEKLGQITIVLGKDYEFQTMESLLPVPAKPVTSPTASSTSLSPNPNPSSPL